VWFNLVDEALTYMTDKEIYEAGLVVVPDAAEVPASTGEARIKLFDTLNGILEEKGKIMHGGTIKGINIR
jgi:hypothetical protein